MDLAPELNRFLAKHVKGVSVDAQAILAHAIRPPSSYRASSDHGPQASTVRFRPVLPPPGTSYDLNVAAFQVALDNALKDGVAGYVAQLRQSGQVLFTNEWQYAKRPQDGAESWTPDVQMHVASVSKLMTAMAMTVLFRDNNISPDAKIIDFLPDYWVKGPNIEYIVFRNLLNSTALTRVPIAPLQLGELDAELPQSLPGPLCVALSSLGVATLRPGDLPHGFRHHLLLRSA